MRIAIDIKAFKNNKTGVSRYLKEILDVLQKIDAKNDYFLFECKPSNYCIVNSRWKIVTTAWKLPGIVWQQLYLPFLLNKFSIEVLWAPEQICPIFSGKKIKIILSIHDLVSFHFPKTSLWSVTLIHKLFGLTSVKAASVLIPVSEYIRHDVMSVYGATAHHKKTITVSNGKPSWSLPPNYSAKNRQPFLFFAGNSEPRKNLISLIKGLEILFDSGKVIPLHIAGPLGWKNKSFTTYCKNSRIFNQIKHLGYCSEEALKEQYLSCTALVYPSVYEGFGLPVLEALCCDCLVVTSKETVMQEIAGNCALYFNPLDPHDIAKTIDHIYGKSFNRNIYLQNANSVLHKYSWETSGKNLLAILNHQN